MAVGSGTRQAAGASEGGLSEIASSTFTRYPVYSTEDPMLTIERPVGFTTTTELRWRAE